MNLNEITVDDVDAGNVEWLKQCYNNGILAYKVTIGTYKKIISFKRKVNKLISSGTNKEKAILKAKQEALEEAKEIYNQVLYVIYFFSELTKLTLDDIINQDNSIKGITIEKDQDVYNFRIQRTIEGKLKSTSVSITEHGFDSAFERAVYNLCNWLLIYNDDCMNRIITQTKSEYNRKWMKMSKKNKQSTNVT